MRRTLLPSSGSAAVGSEGGSEVGSLVGPQVGSRAESGSKREWGVFVPITPGLIDAILVGIGIESGLLAAGLVRRSAGRWIAPLLLFLASGAFLMLALRAALADAAHIWIAAALLGSLVSHLATLGLLHRELLGSRSETPSSGRETVPPDR